MGEKKGKPWSFGLSGGTGSNKSLILFFVVVVIALLTHVGGWVQGMRKESKEKPSLAINSLLRDTRTFAKSEKRMPANFKEIEDVVWNKGVAGAGTRLSHGNYIYVANNYEYFYFAGKNSDSYVKVNLWAIPLGKYRDEADTFLMVIDADGEDIWKGPALTAEQRKLVLEKNLGILLPDLSDMNMKLATGKDQKKKS